MLPETKVLVAFASSTGERVDIGIEDKGKILVYEVSCTKAKILKTYFFRKGIRSVGKGRPRKSLPTQEEIIGLEGDALAALQERYAILKDIPVLVVYKDLPTEYVMLAKEDKMYPVKVERKEFIGVVILRLQELLKENRLLWVRRSVYRTIIDK